MKYIGIGNITKYNIYILIAFLSDFSRAILFGLNSSNSKKPARVFPFKAKIRSHRLLNNFIRLSSVFFGGVILYFFEGRNKKNKKDEDEGEDEDETTIEEYEKMKKELTNKKGGLLTFDIILIGIIFSLYVIITDFINLTKIQGFWSIEILYIAIISYWIFKNKIYKHKKFAIYIMLVVAIIDFIEYFFPSTKHNNSESNNELTDKNIFDVLKIKYGVYSIPLIIIASEIKHIQRDYCWIKAKYLMDIKSQYPYKIFLSIGIIGIFFVIIFFSIFTYVPCKTFNNINKIDGNYFYNNTSEKVKLYLEYCSLKDYDENTKALYLFYDNIKLISKEYSNTDKDNMLEIFLLIPLYFLFYVVNEISRLMMVRYSDPNSILIYHNFYSFVLRLIQFIINEGNEQFLTLRKFFILEFEEIIAIISSLIYIELLELKFCGLDHELMKNIDKRGTEDIIKGLDMDIDAESTLSGIDELQINE